MVEGSEEGGGEGPGCLASRDPDSLLQVAEHVAGAGIKPYHTDTGEKTHTPLRRLTLRYLILQRARVQQT